MKRTILVIIAILTFTFSFAQENKKEMLIVSEFKKAFNTNNIEDIYKLFSKEKMKSFSIDQADASFKRIHNSKGDITSIEFLRKDKDFSVFKTIFTKTVAEIVIKLNQSGKAEVLGIRNTIN